MDKIIQNYLLDEATDQELKLLHEWIMDNPAHKNEFLKSKDVWDSAQAELIRHKIDSNKAFQSFQNRISGIEVKKNETATKSSSFNFRTPHWVAAACILLMISLSIIYFSGNSNAEVIVFNDKSAPMADTLADNSIITLDEQCKVVIREKYNVTNRVIDLEGKAYFSVEKNKKIPFIVYTPNLKIEVIGTSFQINTNYNPNKEEIIVESGQVKLSKRSGEEASWLINGGERIVFSRSDQSILKLPNNKLNFASWISGKIFFDNTPLPVVFSELEGFFSIAINFDHKEFENYRYTARFGNKNLEAILETIEMVYRVDIVKESDRVYRVKSK